MRKRLWLFAILLAPAFLVPKTTGQPGSTSTMRAHFIDVGQGASTLIEFPCAAILVDTGGEENGEFKSDDALMEYLDSFFGRRADLNKTLASVILTHPHVDHTRGVPAVLAKYRVQNAVTNGQETGSGKIGQVALHKYVAESESVSGAKVGFAAVHVKDVQVGKGLTNDAIDPVKCADVDPRITALWGSQTTTPTGWKATDFNNLNNHSVAVRIDFGKASLLVPGDLEEAAIPDFIKHYANTKLLDVDVYQVGHHGSQNGTTHDLVNAMTPAIAVIAMGPWTRETTWTAWAYGHPRKPIVDLLVSHVSATRPKTTVHVATAVKSFTTMTLEKAIYGTGWDGTVVLEADTDGGWRVVKQADVAPVPVARPSLVNLNTATVDELMTLPMIGPSRARAIVSNRRENGRFDTPEDLTRIPGIGSGTINAIRNLVTTN